MEKLKLKILHSFMTKRTFTATRNRKYFLHLIKGMYENSTVIIIVNGEILHLFLLK